MGSEDVYIVDTMTIFNNRPVCNHNINGGDVQRKNVVNNVDKSSVWAP